MDLDDILQVFFEETDEHLETLERLLLNLDPDSPDESDINAILRAAHSVKGNSATCGLETISMVAHEMESLLDVVRKKTSKLTSEAIDVLLEANDNLIAQLDVYKAGDSVAEATIQPICSKLELARRGLPFLAGTTESIHDTDIHKTSDSTVNAAKAKLQALVQNTERTVQIMFIVNERDWPLEHIFLALKEFGSYKILDKKTPKDQKPGHLDVMLHAILTTEAPDDEIRDTLSFVVESEDHLLITSATGIAGSDFGLFDVVFTEQGEEVVITLPQEELPDVLNNNETLVLDKQPDAVQELVSKLPPPDEDDPWGMDHLAKPEEKGVVLGFREPVIEKSVAPTVEEKITKRVPGPTVVMDHPMGTPVTEASPPPSLNVTKDSRKHQRAADRREAAADAVSLRVNLNKVEQVVDYVGELVIAQNLLQQKTDSLNPDDHSALLETLNQVLVQTRALQESVLSIRMTPMATVFNRFYRMVRELNAKLGKNVVLKVMGETTEMDKILVEKLVDPMAHLIRNAMDHGVEKPEIRAAKGKPEEGYVMLRAFHRANNVVIEILDDGAGMDRDRLLAKGMERGILKKPASEMTDSEVWNLIFEPGFSTAEAVTDVSGRGVGMDVVKQNILDLNGRVDVYSAPGKGSKITLTLPLTLSILDGMTVQVSGQSFIVPTHNLLHTMVPEQEAVKVVRGYGQVVEYDGEFIPLARLSSVFELDEDTVAYENGVWLVLESGDARMAVWVERLEGQSQVVLKSLEKNYRKSQGVFGATVLKDGSIALILEPGDVIEMASAQRSRAWALAPELKI